MKTIAHSTRRVRRSGALVQNAFAVVLFSVATFALCAATRIDTAQQAPFPEIFVVNSTGDGDDAFPGDGNCETQVGNGVCTLRAAIEEANAHAGGDGISFSIPTTDPGYSNGVWTVRLTKALPNVSDSVNITGPGVDKLIVQRSTVSGTPLFRIFNVTTAGTVNFSGITMTNGSATNENTGQLNSGGGIRNLNGGTVNVTNCTLSGNSAVGNGSSTAAFGGGIFNNSTGTVNVTNSTLTANSATGGGLAGRGGAICNNGTGIVNVTNGTLSGNTADVSGGGIDNLSTGTVNLTNSMLSSNRVGGLCCGGAGAAIDNFSGTVSITNSTVSGNSFIVNSNTSGFRYYGGGINTSCGTVTVTNSTISNNSSMIGGGISSFPNQFGCGTVTITNSTISGNSADTSQYDATMQGPGGGGGIYVRFGALNVTNSTLSGNGVFSPGGSIGGGAICVVTDTSSTVNISNSTLASNSVFGQGSSGGGIFNPGTGPLNIKSSIIALNTSTTLGPDVFGTFTSKGFNLIGKKDGSTGFAAATDKKGTVASPLNPKLDWKGLRDNGGPTQTVALLQGSPAIDKGTSNGLTGTLTTDQRGFARTVDNTSITNVTGGDGTDIGAFEFGAH